MNILYTLIGAAMALLTVSSTLAGESDASQRAKVRGKAAEILSAALENSRKAEPSEALIGLKRAAGEAIELLGESNAANLLRAAIEQPTQAVQADADSVRKLRAAFAEIAKMLSFQYVKEAELPRGFPEPTPVGELEVKDYPAYRMARAESAGGSAFWTLFRHIKRNDIAMTAPVELTLSKDGASQRERNMAFLYGDTDLGKPGKDGSVEVVDVPSMSAVSIGLSGSQTPQRVAEVQRRLEEWLEANKAGYAVDGPMRILGYNSPFIPREKQFFEVQIPVRRVP